MVQNGNFINDEGLKVEAPSWKLEVDSYIWKSKLEVESRNWQSEA